jgi:hypothetical protein
MKNEYRDYADVLVDEIKKAIDDMEIIEKHIKKSFFKRASRINLFDGKIKQSKKDINVKFFKKIL